MKPWFILASGPSMCREDAEAVCGQGVVVVINSTVQLAPWADVLYACDAKWWHKYRALWRDFGGKKVCLRTDEPVPVGVDPQDWEEAEGLGRERMRPGGNSGFQAINFAYLQGAQTIVLLGYDMETTNGRAHWHLDHSASLGNINDGVMRLFRYRMQFLARDLEREGVRVINASRHSALTCFERMPLDRALSLIRQPNPVQAGTTAGLVPVFS